jgi:hypothetical protein
MSPRTADIALDAGRRLADLPPDLAVIALQDEEQ